MSNGFSETLLHRLGLFYFNPDTHHCLLAFRLINNFAEFSGWNTMAGIIDDKCVRRTIEIARESVGNGGRPFATVIADEHGNIVAEATNQVVQTHDPTAHAEIEAIRIACKKLETEHLRDYTFYILAHPCPMCLAAMYYTSPNKVVFLTTREDYGKLYKDERRWHTFENFYAEFGKDYKDRTMPMIYYPQEEGLAVYEYWKKVNEKK